MVEPKPSNINELKDYCITVRDYKWGSENSPGPEARAAAIQTLKLIEEYEAILWQYDHLQNIFTHHIWKN